MILYYSRGKKTKIFADALGEILGMEVTELESELNDKTTIGFMLKALSLAFSGKSYPVSNMPQNLPDEIYLCTPVWGGQPAAPAKFFLENANLNETTVNILLTASVPVEKYKIAALDDLNRIRCRPGRAFIFATSDKAAPEPDVVKEQLREML